MSKNKDERSYDEKDNMEKTFYGIDTYTPVSEILAKKYKLCASAVFGRIWVLSKKYGYSYSSNRNMAFDIGTDERTFARAIKLLLDNKLILDTTRKNWKHYERNILNKYKIKFRYASKLKLYTPNPDRLKEVVEEWKNSFYLNDEDLDKDIDKDINDENEIDSQEDIDWNDQDEQDDEW